VPGFTYRAVVSFVVTCATDVSSFNADTFASNLAALLAGVTAPDIAISSDAVAGASGGLRVSAVIMLPSRQDADALATLRRVAASPPELSSALGLTVIAAEAPTATSAMLGRPSPSPAPPTPSPPAPPLTPPPATPPGNIAWRIQEFVRSFHPAVLFAAVIGILALLLIACVCFALKCRRRRGRPLAAADARALYQAELNNHRSARPGPTRGKGHGPMVQMHQMRQVEQLVTARF
jgi:hypothetical protein